MPPRDACALRAAHRENERESYAGVSTCGTRAIFTPPPCVTRVTEANRRGPVPGRADLTATAFTERRSESSVAMYTCGRRIAGRHPMKEENMMCT